VERIVICIVGPTCSGKTRLGILLSEKLKGEIISADSRQIYKYLDIGTAKPSSKELQKYKHHFVNELNPDQEFNVSKFEQEALETINRIFTKGKNPIVVGGSGLYVKALIDGIFNSVDTDEQFRKNLFELREKYGNEYLYKKLEKVDAESAGKMKPPNWKRVIRALEIYHITGEKIGDLQKKYKRNDEFIFEQHGLTWNREILYENIEKRVDEMIEKGLIVEVRKIINKGYDKGLNSLNTVGYKEIISFLEEEYPLERAIELIKRNTRRFAKRQMTWFRKDERIIWHKVERESDINQIANKIADNFL
jgi:tRNA dimethylallyltransferase